MARDLSQHLRHPCGTGRHHTTHGGVVLVRELPRWETVRRACGAAGRTRGPICRPCSSSSESRAAGLPRSCSHLRSSSSQGLFVLPGVVPSSRIKPNATQSALWQQWLEADRTKAWFCPILNWEHSTSPGHTNRERGDLQHP